VKRSRERVQVWPAPIVLGVVSAFGLLAALLSDDVGDVLAWFALLAPVVTIMWYLMRRKTVR
jgi:hypothetical protein